MRKTLRLFLKTFVICSMCFAIFIGAGYYYLSENLTTADEKVENIPYSQTIGDNKGILLTVSGRNTFFYLDFLENKIIVSLNPENTVEGQIYGYSHDYTISGESDLIIEIIDSIGGIELNIKGEQLRYTGIQTSELLKRSNSNDLRKEVIIASCNKIAKYGVNSAFFGEIINNCKTDLSLVDCYFWHEYLTDLCDNLHFID